MSASLSARALLAYGALGLPLAFAAVPIYVQVPKLYAESLGLPLAVVGAVLLLTRLADALIDPLLGALSDAFRHRRVLIALACPLLAGGMWALFNPLPGAGAPWLAACLACVYLGFSLASINYHAWGAEISDFTHERTRITAVREALGLIGVMAAAVLPSLMSPDFAQGLSRASGVFIVLLGCAALLTLWGAPPAAPKVSPHPGVIALLASVMRDDRFMRLLAVFALNGIASAIPATLVLFFVADVLALPQHAGLFLVIYFAGGVLGLPLWVALSKRVGKPLAWLASMLLAVAAFAFAGVLGQGDAIGFAFICLASGVALGADLALPPSMLADGMMKEGASHAGGAYFGLWNFVTKLNLALAAGLTLPALEWAGYAPGQGVSGGQAALVFAYAFAPLVLKLAAAVLLWRYRHGFDETRSD